MLGEWRCMGSCQEAPHLLAVPHHYPYLDGMGYKGLAPSTPSSFILVSRQFRVLPFLDIPLSLSWIFTFSSLDWNFLFKLWSSTCTVLEIFMIGFLADVWNFLYLYRELLADSLALVGPTSSLKVSLFLSIVKIGSFLVPFISL
ncbi:hypothetical protein ACH5RR_032305 [Cinchona calisaya]|uniref:Uncharacterized protein n=1 Tax=Cinchona calisaya TaxID=153742 RepID=A0ABD2YHR8_9GENT